MDEEILTQRARDLKDMIETAGWALLKNELEKEIEFEISSLREIELEKRGLTEIAADYITHRERLSGLKRVFEIIQEICQ